MLLQSDPSRSRFFIPTALWRTQVAKLDISSNALVALQRLKAEKLGDIDGISIAELRRYLGRSVDCVAMTDLACAGLDKNPGICLTHPLDPAQPGRVSISIAWAHNWRWQSLTGDRPAAGLIAAAGEFQHGQHWCLLATDGLYRSVDGGRTLETVLDNAGTPRSR